MKVLVVTPHFPPSHVGGVEAYTKAMADRLHAGGHRVDVATVASVVHGATDACEAESDERDGYRVHRIALTVQRGRPIRLLWEHDGLERWFDDIISRVSPDVVHVHSGYLLGGPALSAGIRSGIPTVLSLHDYWFACPRITLQHFDGAICSGPETPAKCAWCLATDKRRYRVAGRIFGDRLERVTRRPAVSRMLLGGTTHAIEARQAGLLKVLHDTAAIVAPTRFVAERVAALGYPLERITVSRYGLPPIGSLRVSAPEGRLRLAYIGQIVPHKGVALAIEAVRANPDPRLTLAVHGPLATYPRYVEQLRALAAGDDRITFHGPYGRDALASILGACDAVVVPSVWLEVAGLVIQEAQGVCVPVIGSRLGGIPELVDHEVNGLLFDPFTPGDLGRQISRLLQEPDLLARLRAGTRPPPTIQDDVRSLLEIYAALSRRR